MSVYTDPDAGVFLRGFLTVEALAENPVGGGVERGERFLHYQNNHALTIYHRITLEWVPGSRAPLSQND